MKHLPLLAAIAAAVLCTAAVAGFGTALEGYSQSMHPVGLLGARGLPHALAFNAVGFALPGALVAFVAWRLRAAIGDDGPWIARIGAWLALLSALAFAAQGLLPLDPRDLESDASRAHAIAWALWWVAFVAAAALLAAGLRRTRPSRVLGLASLVAAALIAMPVMLPLDLLAPALAQRVAFAAWLAWGGVAGSWIHSREGESPVRRPRD